MATTRLIFFPRDILNYQFSLDLQDFKAGTDGGIDLRCSSELNGNSIIVQAKHYQKSGYNSLFKTLVNVELPKVIALKPDRYMIATSVEMSPQQKDKIFQHFKPFLNSTNDIFGKEDLNKYLETFPEIETKWYKLWLSSVNVLNTILYNAVLGRSSFAENKIRSAIQLYVHTQNYNDAFDILKHNKYILITGQPGVGKTTLASLLTYRLLAQKYQLVYIDSEVKDAEQLFDNSPEIKQLFFFDDFLGANYLEIFQPKTTESAFVNFLERIQATEGKYLVLTTRTSIFRNAIDKFEKMKRIKLEIARHEIELGQYSNLDKAKILYNHIYHSSLPDHLRQEVLSNGNYWKVILHRNYNPRLIEFITNVKNSGLIKKGSYMSFVINSLDNPEEVWRHAYEQQLTLEEKVLLLSIYSQKYSSSEADTKEIFDVMLKYEIANKNHVPAINPFHNACKNLLDGILKREVIFSSKQGSITFINPAAQTVHSL